MSSSGRLSGACVLVSGGASGMGAAQVAHLVAEGAQVIVADIRADAAERVADTLGGSAVSVELDVRSPDDWRRAVQLSEDAFGQPLSGMVNNAGVDGGAALVADTPIEDYMNTIAVNQVGTLLGIQACAPAMREHGGSIVCIASVVGLSSLPGAAGYVSSKYAVRGLARVAAVELARTGIRVNTVCPGAIDTPMLRAGSEDPDALEPIARQIPMRAVGDPSAVAKGVAFLLSDDAAYITGTDLVIDGGVMAKLPLNMRR